MSQLPWQINVGANLAAREGYGVPYYRDVTSSDPSLSRKRVLLVDPKDPRLPAVVSFDARVEKTFRFSGRTLALDFDIFNLMNRSTVLGRNYDVSSVTGFNEPLEIMNPRHREADNVAKPSHTMPRKRRVLAYTRETHGRRRGGERVRYAQIHHCAGAECHGHQDVVLAARRLIVCVHARPDPAVFAGARRSAAAGRSAAAAPPIHAIDRLRGCIPSGRGCVGSSGRGGRGA